MKKISCGVIITDVKGDYLLGIVPWGKHNALDIPKGLMEPGEYPVTCALRELREETGLAIRASQLEDLGEFKYTPEKQLHLFLFRARSMPDIKTLRCVSMMSNPIRPEAAPVPEVVGYDIVSFNDPRFYKSLRPILLHVQNSL